MNNTLKKGNSNIMTKLGEGERVKNVVNNKMSYMFIITVIVGVLILIYVIYTIRNYMYYKKSSPFLIESTIDASSTPMVVNANKINPKGFAILDILNSGIKFSFDIVSVSGVDIYIL